MREHKVVLDSDLAAIYGVSTGRFNEAVKRNLKRFPDDFSFLLSREEADELISQNAISKPKRGGRTKLPRVFTEHGALMAASILSSDRAIAMSVYVIRAFVELRNRLAGNSTILKRLAEIDRDLILHDDSLRDIYESFNLSSLRRPSRSGRRLVSRAINPGLGTSASLEWHPILVRPFGFFDLTLELREASDYWQSLA